MSARARPPRGGAPSHGEDIAQRQEGTPVGAGMPQPLAGITVLVQSVVWWQFLQSFGETMSGAVWSAGRTCRPSAAPG